MSTPVRIVLQLFGLLPDGSSAAAKLTADQRLQVSTGLAQPTTPTDTQPVSAAALPLPNGAATSINQDITNTALGKQVGTWGYKAGVAGSPTLPAGAKVLQISAVCTSAAGSFTINGGDSIAVPQYVASTFEPRGNLVAPALVFSSTDSYLVEYVL